jgi:hypothetical protein
MTTMRLDELLPASGVGVVANFAAELTAGRWKRRDYLDIHAALRERLLPFKAHYHERGMLDDDYFVTIILRGLGTQNLNSSNSG